MALTSQIFDLSEDQGINRVVDQNPQHIVSFAAEDYFGDVDTPQDYESLHGEWQDSPPG